MDYFLVMKQRMEEQYGASALRHPHAGMIGPGLNPYQALATINPAFQSPQQYSHITRDYNTPITIQEEPFQPDTDVVMET